VGRDRDRAAARRREPALQLVGEQHVGQLGLPVREPALVAAPLPVEVVADPAEDVEAAGHGDDAVAHPVDQQAGERERAEVVGADVALEAVRRRAVRHRHDPGVVDEDVDRAVQFRGEGAHRRQVGEVELPDLRVAVDRAGHGLGLVAVAARHDDGGAGTGEDARGLGTEPAGGAGDDDGASTKIGHVVHGPGAHVRVPSVASSGTSLAEPQSRRQALIA
jgi:hypothetical protein